MGTSLVWSIGDVVCQFEVLPDSHWPFHVRLVHDDGDSVIQDAWVASRDEAMQLARTWFEEERVFTLRHRWAPVPLLALPTWD